MTTAWQKRSWERQEFLLSLKNKVMTLEDVYHGRIFLYNLATTLLQFLQNGAMKLSDQRPEEEFLRGALEKLETFARAKEERDAILSELLVWVVTSITTRFQQDLLSAERVKPLEIFRADSPMSDAEISLN